MFEWGTGSYYDKPFEITADKFGGVESRIHSRDKIYAGFDYLKRVQNIAFLRGAIFRSKK